MALAGARTVLGEPCAVRDMRFEGALLLSEQTAVGASASAKDPGVVEFTVGTNQLTNMAFGVLRKEVRAFGSSDAATNEWFNDGRGFPTNAVQYTGTADPNVTNQFLYNARGEMVFNPPPDNPVNGADYLIVMGRPENLRALEALLAGTRSARP